MTDARISNCGADSSPEGFLIVSQVAVAPGGAAKPVYAASNVRSPAATEGVQDGGQDDCANNRDHQCSPEAGSTAHEEADDQAADERTDQPDDDIANEAKAATHDAARDPAGETTDDQPHDEVTGCKRHCGERCYMQHDMFSSILSDAAWQECVLVDAA